MKETRPAIRSLLRLVAIAAFLAVGVLAWLYVDQDNKATNIAGDNPRIAVLPFDDLSAGPDKGYLSDAIAEGIITELARNHSFAVIARNSNFRYRDADIDLCDVGEVDPDSHFGYMGLAFAYRHAATFGWQGLNHDEAVEFGLKNGLIALSISH